MQKYLTAQGYDQFIGVEKGQKSPSGLFYLFITAIIRIAVHFADGNCSQSVWKGPLNVGDFIGAR